MSSPSEEPELKAGHPPAVKAGGKRIPTKHHHQPPPPAPTPEEKAENEEFEEPKERDTTKLVVSGAVAKGNADLPPEAARVAHEKPMPQHDKRPPPHAGGKGGNIHIQQPRKH
ncbi:death-associated protein 1 [Exaiptasia diaphana]|uniref:Death-associated protein 1 n=1 Tax=Exaiptasia diaphana TaxID=2652724 RepID=A0A913X238_EXADI|nr:death-associated protein 1 [Exaiptasia diaphana]KXJ06245.1 Death-associated protein 1 [Exaiptasia diaphana]